MKWSLWLLLSSGVVADPTLQCLDQQGKPVDWWFMYKMHAVTNYAYKDSNDLTYDALHTLLSPTLNDTDSPIGYTVQSFYDLSDKADTHMWSMWNDEKPSSSSSPADFREFGQHATFDEDNGEGAHSKGMMVGNEDGGFYLLHSIPAYPEAQMAKYSYTGAMEYGQTMLCITLGKSGIEALAAQFQFYGLLQYSKNLVPELQSSMPNFYSVVSGIKQKGTSIASFKSFGGHSFDNFAKDDTWGGDLYEDLVEPYYKSTTTSWKWETWRRSPYLPTYCQKDGYAYDSMNVQYMNFTGADGQEVYDFHYTLDHSKWGLSTDSNLLCVSGTNRMESQRVRGGGAVCFSRASLHNALEKVIQSADTCDDDTLFADAE